MIKKRYLIFLSVALISCTDKGKPDALPKFVQQEKAIDINSVTVDLPYGDNMELVQANCMTCHSLKYIEMQPDFNHKTWEKIVKKMVKTYGAPISDTLTVNKIIDYLVAVKGNK